MFDLYVYVYAAVGIIIVMVSYVLFATLAVSVKSIHKKMNESEKKKKVDEARKKAA